MTPDLIRIKDLLERLRVKAGDPMPPVAVLWEAATALEAAHTRIAELEAERDEAKHEAVCLSEALTEANTSLQRLTEAARLMRGGILKEREACAKVAEATGHEWDGLGAECKVLTNRIATAIRARVTLGGGA